MMESITAEQWLDACIASPNDLDNVEFMGSYVKDNGDRVYWTQVDTPEFEYVCKHELKEFAFTKYYYMGSK